MIFKSAKANKISEHISEQIRKAIFEGKFKPGDRLPPEKELMEAFEVSKATLREGFRALETLGFLEVRKGASGGAFVTEVNMKTARECLSNFLRFQNLSLTDLSEVRILVETYIAEKAAQIITEEDLRKLQKLNEEFEDNIKKRFPPEFYNHQVEFHRIIGNVTGNPLLTFILDFIINILIGMKENLRPSKEFYKRVLRAHKRIYEAILERNPQKARKEMVLHIQEEERDLLAIQKQPPSVSHDLRNSPLLDLIRSNGLR